MIKKIPTEEPEVGMYVSDFDTPWFNHPFLTGRKRIVSTADIDKILEHGIREVYFDTSKGSGTTKGASVREVDRDKRRRLLQEVEGIEVPGAWRSDAASISVSAPSEKTPFDEELERAFEIYNEAVAMLQDLFSDACMGRSVDGERTRQAMQDMVGSIFRNRDALLSLSRVNARDRHTLNHSLNVAVLSLSLGVSLGVLDQELQRLGIGAGYRPTKPSNRSTTGEGRTTIPSTCRSSSSAWESTPSAPSSGWKPERWG